MRSMIDYAYYFQHCFFCLNTVLKLYSLLLLKDSGEKKRERETVEFDVVFFGIISK